MESWSILEKEPTATKFINSYATNSSIQNVSDNHDTHQRTETVDNYVKEQIYSKSRCTNILYKQSGMQGCL